MNEDWVKVFTSSDTFKSEMVKQFLVESGVEAVILDKQGYPYIIGETEVYVSPTVAQQAIDLISQSGL